MTPAETGTPRTEALLSKAYVAGQTLIEAGVIDHARTLERELSASRSECERVKRALCSLTPGGSEYAGNTDACVAYVREVRDSQHEAIMKFSHRARQAEQTVAQLRAELSAARACIRDAMEIPELPYFKELKIGLAWKKQHAPAIEAAKGDK